MFPPFCMPIKTSDQQLTFCIAPFAWYLPCSSTTPRSLLFSLSPSLSVPSISPSQRFPVGQWAPVSAGRAAWGGGGVGVKEGNGAGKVIAGAPTRRHHLPHFKACKVTSLHPFFSSALPCSSLPRSLSLATPLDLTVPWF